MKSPAIQIEHWSFHYEEGEILADINCEIREGDYVSIIGPNGAGKSTLLKCLNRIVRGGQGAIKLFGKALSEYSQKELGKTIGYVAQSQEQLFPYTVYEFVLMGRYPYLKPFSRVALEDHHAVEESLKLTDVWPLAHRRINQLSGGEKQKVCLAAGLAQQPRILLLDEPTAHLDPQYHMDIQQTISRISSEKGMTIVHVTHDLNHILFWSQKVLALKTGRVFSFGRPEDVLTKENLKKIFNTEFFLLEHPSAQKAIVVPEVRL